MVLLWYGVLTWGIIGAALAWTIRVALDAALLTLYVQLSSYLSPSWMMAKLRWTLLLTLLLVSSGWLLYALTGNLILKIVVWGLVLGLLMLGAWIKSMTSEEKEKVARCLNLAVIRAVLGRMFTRRRRLRQ